MKNQFEEKSKKMRRAGLFWKNQRQKGILWDRCLQRKRRETKSLMMIFKKLNLSSATMTNKMPWLLRQVSRILQTSMNLNPKESPRMKTFAMETRQATNSGDRELPWMPPKVHCWLRLVLHKKRTLRRETTTTCHTICSSKDKSFNSKRTQLQRTALRRISRERRTRKRRASSGLSKTM